jgi:Tfp pilus assembly protein PilF
VTLVEKFENMLASGKDHALLRFSLGSEYFKLNDFDKAALHLRLALQHDPKYSAAWKLLGKALTQSKKFDEAQQAYRQGIEIAEQYGDIQAAKEMKVFLSRLNGRAV